MRDALEASGAEMVTVASLARKESRWGIYHYRVDFPQRDDDVWRKFVVVTRDDAGRPSVSTQPVAGG